MWPWLLLLFLLFAYLSILAAIYFAQTRILFPAHAVPAAGPVPEHGRRLTLQGSDHRIHGVYLAPIEEGPRPLILVFGGNAWNAQSAADYVQDLFPAAEVVAFHYRGYAPSGGMAAASSLQEDALSIYDWARQEFGPRPTVAVGFSIGSGVAAYLAAHRPIDGAILVTPFDSLSEVAASHYPWLPVRLLFRHQMDSAEALGRSQVPVAILIAGNDRLISPVRAEALAKAAGNVRFKETIAGASHNDIYERGRFKLAMRAAMDALQGP